MDFDQASAVSSVAPPGFTAPPRAIAATPAPATVDLGTARVVAPSPHAGQIGVALSVATLALMALGAYLLFLKPTAPPAAQSPALVQQLFTEYTNALEAA